MNIQIPKLKVNIIQQTELFLFLFFKSTQLDIKKTCSHCLEFHEFCNSFVYGKEPDTCVCVVFIVKWHVQS